MIFPQMSQIAQIFVTNLRIFYIRKGMPLPYYRSRGKNRAHKNPSAAKPTNHKKTC